MLFTSGKRDVLPVLNNYVKESTAKTGYPALYYSCPEQSGEELERQIREGGFLGLKSYLNLAPDYIPEKEIRIFDFCANSCEYAMTKSVEAVGPDRIMFGSDLPILRMRTHRIEENSTYINLIPPGLYGDPSQDKHLREVSEDEAKKITFFMYEEILAFKRVAARLGLTKEDINQIFCLNAKNLIETTRKISMKPCDSGIAL